MRYKIEITHEADNTPVETVIVNTPTHPLNLLNLTNFCFCEKCKEYVEAEDFLLTSCRSCGKS